MSISKRLHYKSDQIEVTYDPKICIHAAECVKGLPQVFNPNKKPWVDPNSAEADEIAAVIHKCPTGALRYNRLDGGANEPVPSSTRIVAVKNGPIYVTGNIKITGSDGNPLDAAPRVALCRCGHSGNKPFCDNTHKEINFDAE